MVKQTRIAGASSNGAATSTISRRRACVLTATVHPPFSSSSNRPCVPVFCTRKWSTSSITARTLVNGALLMFPKKIDIRPWDPEYSCFTPTCSIAFSKRTPDGDVHKLEKAFRIAGMTSLGIPIFCDLSNSGRVPPGLLSAIGKRNMSI